ncbi:hypothetical protein, partial [Ferrovum sp.]|uniref:hypothetical protein n=1 Tax=Ferrovum sp. TaxID=2609467 RepID=UPI00260C52DB
MPLKGDGKNTDVSETENEHTPVDEPREGMRIIRLTVPPAPVVEVTAPQETHQGCTEHAAIAHTRQHSADDHAPKAARHDGFFLHSSPLSFVFTEINDIQQLTKLFILLIISLVPLVGRFLAVSTSHATLYQHPVRFSTHPHWKFFFLT